MKGYLRSTPTLAICQDARHNPEPVFGVQASACRAAVRLSSLYDKQADSALHGAVLLLR